MNQSVSGKWTFLTNHAHVLLCVAGNPSIKMKEIALKIGITERAVQKIIADLCSERYIEIIRSGRSNLYKLNDFQHLKHPIEAHKQISCLIELVKKIE